MYVCTTFPSSVSNIGPSGKKGGLSKAYLDCAGKEGVQHVSPLLHFPDIGRGGVSALAVLDWIGKSISELLQGSQQVRFDEVHHGVICGVCVCVCVLKHAIHNYTCKCVRALTRTTVLTSYYSDMYTIENQVAFLQQSPLHNLHASYMYM